MYKVLIADDEEIIRKGLARFLKKDPELEVVAEAEDGEVALALTRQKKPDLLLVDINMPFLNGLQFIEALQEAMERPVIVIITGYDSFAYAQKALRLGVMDYLLKPISEHTLFPVLDRAKALIRSKREKINYLTWAQLQVEKNRDALIAEFLTKWLDGHFGDTEIQGRMAFLDIQLPVPFGVTAVQLHAKDTVEYTGGGWNEDLLHYAAENITREIMAPFSPLYLCKCEENALVFLSDIVPETEWRAKAAILQQLLQRHLPVVAIVAQARGEQYLKLPELWERLREELHTMVGSHKAVLDAKAMVDKNYYQKTLSLQIVAEELHLSSQHLSRIFRQEMGITFVDYLTKVRIRRAMELLVNSQDKIYEITEKVGYSSQHYFCNVFKKIMGVSPAEYRKNEQER